MTKTREERNAWQREYRRKNNNSETKKYERTKKGKLMRTYRNMESRVKGLAKPNLYLGLELLPRGDFYEWALGDDGFNRLYETWVRNDYDRKLSPSIDRIDTSIGYVDGNIRWVTHSENSRLGGMHRKNND